MDHDYMKRGYLLPEGCKDLIDVLNLQRKQELPNPYFLPKLPQQFPQPSKAWKTLLQPWEQPPPIKGEIAVPAQTTVSQLAAMLGQKPFHIIADLMELGIFVNVAHLLNFQTISKIATKHGFIAKKAP